MLNPGTQSDEEQDICVACKTRHVEGKLQGRKAIPQSLDSGEAGRHLDWVIKMNVTSEGQVDTVHHQVRNSEGDISSVAFPLRMHNPVLILREHQTQNE